MSTVGDEVARSFERLAAGELTQAETSPRSGWEVALPSGRIVARSTLQAEARALIALGREAVPFLLDRVRNDNPALRYVAIYTLEQITGVRPPVPYFGRGEPGEDLTRAVEAWRSWYETNAQP